MREEKVMVEENGNQMREIIMEIEGMKKEKIIKKEIKKGVKII